MAPRRSDPNVDLRLFHETIRSRLEWFVGDRSQLQVALQLGLYPGTINRWLHATEAPRAHNLAVIAYRGNVSLDWLFGLHAIERHMRPRTPFIDPGYMDPPVVIPEED